MRPLRNGDLSEIPGAAELIDSAQDAAKKLARCCADKDAEIAELNATVERYQHQVLDQHDEIARLIAELDHLQRRQLAHSAVEVGLLEKVARLREAIRAEAEKHNIFNKPECDCRICRIAREGR